jgi:endonuclease YncB( thermonuclease family)
MKIIIAFILTLSSLSSYADNLQGKVISVTDGDTVKILTSDNEIYKIRLSGIDAPEKRQAFGNKSKQALDDDIGGKVVSVEYNKLDKYQRVIGKITLSVLTRV